MGRYIAAKEVQDAARLLDENLRKIEVVGCTHTLYPSGPLAGISLVAS